MKKIYNTTPEKLYFTYPNTVAVICVKSSNEVFVMPAVWQIPLSHSPMIFGVLVSASRNTFKKILLAKNFSLNYFSFKYSKFVADLGSCSGSSVDKIKKFNIKLTNSKYIDSPILTDAYVSIECDDLKGTTYGDHSLFAGKVKNIWYIKSYFKNNIVDISKVKPILYLGNMTFTTVNDKKIKQCKKK